MVVCRFFQQGYCRYGQNCRFEHIYGSKYTYHANPQQAAPQPAGCTDEQLVNQVQADIQSALLGGQWILSCYAPFKEKPVFPGISDLSPEEARLFIYEAKNNNNLEEAVNYMNNLYKEARQKYEQLLQRNSNIIKVLRSLYKGEIVPSPFSNAPNTLVNDNAASIFRSAITDNSSSIFKQSSTTSNQSDAKSLFANAVQKTNSNPFNLNQPNPSNIFATANQSIFGPNQNSLPFNQAPNSVFNQPQSTPSPFSTGNVFQTADNSKSIFGQINNTDDPGVYSKMEDLSAEDVTAFKSDTFELGFIPEVPPPHQLCTPGF